MMFKNFWMGRNFFLRVAALAALGIMSQTVQAQGFARSTLAYVVGGNYNAGVLLSSGYFDFTDGAPASTGGTLTFNGLDSHGNAQTMDFAGTASAAAEFGRLHASASGTITNPYYNASNPRYVDSVGVHDEGSPDAVHSGGVARFSDTLTFGGLNGTGYRVRYVFHIDGFSTASADGLTYAELIFGVGNNIPEGFRTSAQVAEFGTSSYDVAWNVPTVIGTTFSAVFFQGLNNNRPAYQEGNTITGSANYYNTLELTGIEVLDPSGALASGWTVTSASGTRYPMLAPSAVPEPGFYQMSALLAISGLGVWRKRRSHR